MSYWTYKSNFIPSFVFQPFYEIIKEYCYIGSNKKRYSCVFYITDTKNIYDNLTGYNWIDAPYILVEICKLVEQFTNEKYDYILVHIYPDGNASINWHSDSEAINSTVASVSLGATRKFRFRKIGRTSGWDHELKLNDGDLLIMHGPKHNQLSCQEVYQHCVPVEKKVKEPRINLTFRNY